MFGCTSVDLELSLNNKKLRQFETEVVILGGSEFEEAHFYKPIDDVLLNHTKGIKIVNKLIPIVVAMAPEGTVDPY